MNWYIKQIFAQLSTGFENYLRNNLQVSDDIIEYIFSLDEKTAKFIANEIRKNPSLTLEDIKQINIPQEENPYLPNEIQLAERFGRIEDSNVNFYKWILVNLRKLRKGLFNKDERGRMVYPSNHINLDQNDHYMYELLVSKIGEIRDWVRNTNVDIASFSPDQAIKMSDEWHKAVAGEGEGVTYEPTNPDNIVYGPEWKNPKFNGWTVQKITSENDLLAEGHKMNHCVKSYYKDVISGLSIIYSLRDPSNNPHVTIEVQGEKAYRDDPELGGVVDMRGNSNQKPKEEYRPMIKEWLSNEGENQGISTKVNTFEEVDEGVYEYPSHVSDYNDLMEKIISQETDEYGLEYIFDIDMDILINELLYSYQSASIGDRKSYRGDLTESPPLIVDVAMATDLGLSYFPQNKKELDKNKEQLKNLKTQTNWENIRFLQNWAYKNLDELYEELHNNIVYYDFPQEEDYETTEEYEESVNNYHEMMSEEIDEQIKEYYKGGFAFDILDMIKEYQQEGILPTSEELQSIDKSEKTVTASRNWYKISQKDKILVYRGGEFPKDRLPWFTEDPVEASKYGTVKPYYIETSNPIDIKGGFSASNLREKGYDAVRIINPMSKEGLYDKQQPQWIPLYLSLIQPA